MITPKPDYSAATSLLRSWRRPLLLTHAKPDGDAIGAIVAMRAMARQLGCDPLAVLFDPPAPRYAFLTASEPVAVWGRDVTAESLAGVDGVVVLDTCTLNQVEPLASWLSSSRAPIMAVDHHVTRDIDTKLLIVDESAAATCLILHNWVKSENWSPDAETVQALFVGIATDTGWFRHSNTDQRALAAAAELASRGVRVHELYQLIYQRDSVARVRLLSVLLDTLELHCADRLAVMTLQSSTMKECGARLSDTEDMVNEPLRIDSVVASVLLVEQESADKSVLIRANFRSKPPILRGDPDIDVAAIARSLGGGGHRRAAGARTGMPLDDVKKTVLTVLSTAIVESMWVAPVTPPDV